MRVLLSAYACEPGKGSEPGVGWHWAIEIAQRGHEVTVLTRANNRANIEAGIAADPDFPVTIDFAYYDLPACARSIKRTFKVVLPYYFFWQAGAHRVAEELHRQRAFDLVQHITFATIRHFSFMGRLGIPFVLGPIGGGETSPFWLRWHTGWRGGLRDTWRDFLNRLSSIDPIANRAWRDASVVATTTPDTLRLVPARYREKSRCVLQIGIDDVDVDFAGAVVASKPPVRCKRLLFVGRFLYWKGMSIGLKAFAHARASDPSLTLTLVGKGPEQQRLQKLAHRLGIDGHVHWRPWLPQEELPGCYASHGIFLFPSLHDSGGLVVLEAMRSGLPTICLNLGGPGVVVDESCGQAIDVSHGDFDRLVNEMAKAILDFTADPESWEAASHRARMAGKKSSWAARVEELGVY